MVKSTQEQLESRLNSSRARFIFAVANGAPQNVREIVLKEYSQASDDCSQEKYKGFYAELK